MKYTVDKVEGGVKFSFALSSEEWESELNRSYLKNRGKYNIPGFRKGRATRKLIESMYGGVFFDDAFNGGFYTSYQTALNEHPEVFPVDDPQVDIDGIEDDGSIKFSAVVTVKPEVKLGAFTGLTVTKREYPVEQSEIDARLQSLKEEHVRKVEVTDRPVKDSDTVRLNYEGKVDGVAFAGGTATDQELTIGSNSFIPGFEAQMVGMAIDEVRDLNVTFPDDYHAEELKGKEAIFTVKVLGITEKQYPELDDRFIQDVSEFDTLDAYTADIRKSMQDEKDRRAASEEENELIEAIAANAEVTIPACMIESRIDGMISDMEQRLQYMYRGMQLEEYLRLTGSNLDELRGNYRESAERDVKAQLTLEAVITAQKLEATEDEINAEIQKLAENAEKDAEEYRKEMDPRRLRYIENNLIMDKLLKFLRENNTFAAEKAKKTPAKKTETDQSATKATAKKAPAKSAAADEPAKKVPAKKAPAKKPTKSE